MSLCFILGLSQNGWLDTHECCFLAEQLSRGFSCCVRSEDKMGDWLSEDVHTLAQFPPEYWMKATQTCP